MLETKYLQDNVENIKRLMTIPSLQKFETKHLKRLLKLSKIREYEHGECIIKEGMKDRWLYFLLSGKASVRKGGTEITLIDKMGEIFGEMQIIDRRSRSASVFADGKTICLAVDISATDRLIASDEKANFLLMLYRMFVEFISIRLRCTNEELIKYKKEVQKVS
jgi:signal-transduction protein with cAMP-binding, CBS, and nucleotidyltransferase domain